MQAPLILSGSSHPAFAKALAEASGIPLGEITTTSFPDQECSVVIQTPVQGRAVILVQSLALDPNHYLMELLLMIDGCRRARAASITLVVPYLAYARQDRQLQGRQEPIAARLVAELLEHAGAVEILTSELHTPQLEGFFQMPMRHLCGWSLLIPQLPHLNSPVVIAPDAGAIRHARLVAEEVRAIGVAVIDKKRLAAEEVEIKTFLGQVSGHEVLIVDDMCVTGGTLLAAAAECQRLGARRILAAVMHGVVVKGTAQKIEQSAIETFYMSDSVPYTDRLKGLSKLKRVSLTTLFADELKKIVF